MQAAVLRVVATTAPTGPEPGWRVQPDPGRRLPGRGAYVHPTPDCVHRAIQRMAFGRALRQEGRPDTTALEEWVARRA
ncbi:hypothetical protein GCM10009583_13080 [Ornithinicoccus hortensis]